MFSPVTKLYVPLPVTCVVLASGIPVMVYLNVSASTVILYLYFSLPNDGSKVPLVKLIPDKYGLLFGFLVIFIVYDLTLPSSAITFIVISFAPT